MHEISSETHRVLIASSNPVKVRAIGRVFSGFERGTLPAMYPMSNESIVGIANNAHTKAKEALQSIPDKSNSIVVANDTGIRIHPFYFDRYLKAKRLYRDFPYVISRRIFDRNTVIEYLNYHSKYTLPLECEELASIITKDYDPSFSDLLNTAYALRNLMLSINVKIKYLPIEFISITYTMTEHDVKAGEASTHNPRFMMLLDIDKLNNFIENQIIEYSDGEYANFITVRDDLIGVNVEIDVETMIEETVESSVEKAFNTLTAI